MSAPRSIRVPNLRMRPTYGPAAMMRVYHERTRCLVGHVAVHQLVAGMPRAGDTDAMLWRSGDISEFIVDAITGVVDARAVVVLKLQQRGAEWVGLVPRSDHLHGCVGWVLA